MTSCLRLRYAIVPYLKQLWKTVGAWQSANTDSSQCIFNRTVARVFRRGEFELTLDRQCCWPCLLHMQSTTTQSPSRVLLLVLWNSILFYWNGLWVRYLYCRHGGKLICPNYCHRNTVTCFNYHQIIQNDNKKLLQKFELTLTNHHESAYEITTSSSCLDRNEHKPPVWTGSHSAFCSSPTQRRIRQVSLLFDGKHMLRKATCLRCRWSTLFIVKTHPERLRRVTVT